jgi:acyl-CoA thioester hydrolase
MQAPPFTGYRKTIPPDWINHGGHMGMAYYLVMFDEAVWVFFESIGLGQSRLQAGGAQFAAETHIIYERELHLGDEVVVATTVLDADEKRLHLAQEIFKEGEPARVCLQELMYICVDAATRRVTAWDPAAQARINTVMAAHTNLPRPAKTGRKIAIRQI